MGDDLIGKDAEAAGAFVEAGGAVDVDQHARFQLPDISDLMGQAKHVQGGMGVGDGGEDEAAVFDVYAGDLTFDNDFTQEGQVLVDGFDAFGDGKNRA